MIKEKIAYSKILPMEFVAKVNQVANKLLVNPNYLMACIAFETGETFSPSVLNKQSNAIGLIQFMPFVCASLLGVENEMIKRLSTEDLLEYTKKFARMSAVEQMDYVEKYFLNQVGKLKSLEDLYMAILWPAAVGKDNDYVLFQIGGKYPKRYLQNKGLDFNKDGLITKAEAAAKVRKKLEKGLQLVEGVD